MALTQDERISISSKIVGIPKENAQADFIIGKLDEGLDKVENQDSANKTLMDDKTVFVNAYQGEFTNYDGNVRTSLAEQDLIDSVKKIKNNPFFPNDPLTPITPEVPDGVWKFFPPFAGSKAIGKNNVGVYPSTITGESAMISNINALITTMEGYTGVGRSTGQVCNSGVNGTCSIPMYTTQLDCENNSGIWTPDPDTIEDDPAIQATATSLIDAINDWKTLLNSTFSIIYTSDPDTTRQTQNNAAKADITNAISIIDTWLAYLTFYTSHGQTTCAGFNSLDPLSLPATKFRAAELQPIKNELTARTSFLSTRNSQLTTNLGSVTQDSVDGSIITATGFYGERFRIIELRLNLITGSLTKKYSIENGKDLQNQLKASNDNAEIVYDSVMKATLFKAPSIGSDKIHVEDASEFSVSDSVYIMADEQQEISATITAISGNMVTLSQKIPQKYTTNNVSRMYKVL